MDSSEPPLHMVEGPVVEGADPFEAEDSRTAELPHPGVLPPADDPYDRLVPRASSGLRGWVAKLPGLLGRTWLGLIPVAALALLPVHFFAGRLADTLIAVPALSDIAGGFALLLIPLVWLAYFAVSVLPEVIYVAGAVGVVLPFAADGRVPGWRKTWRLVGYRLRPLWLWLVPFGVLAQSLPLMLNTENLGDGLAVPLALVLGVASTGALTLIGMLGCVLLVEHHTRPGPRRAIHLLTITPATGLTVASLALTALPRVATAVAGVFAGSVTAVLCGVVWAVAALVTYAQARRAEGPVTSGSLRDELATPDLD